MHFIGLDVSKATLDLAGPNLASTSRVLTAKEANTHSGWMQISHWLEHHWGSDRDAIALVMEATGVYHQLAAHYFYAAGFRVIICNPGRAADYSRSQNRLNKTDPLDARSLQRYGERLERTRWFEPDLPEIQQLKALLALLRQLDKDIVRLNNRLEKASYQPAGNVVMPALKRQLRNLQRELGRTQDAIDQIIADSEALKRDQQLLCSITGIGPKTSQLLLPLVHGVPFASARQLAAYLGLTPCHQQSGTSKNVPGRLSGRGDAAIRAAMYMPAMVAMCHDPELRRFYETLRGRGKTGKQAITAIMRKLVHICYGVVKNQVPYRANYGCLP